MKRVTKGQTILDNYFIRPLSKEDTKKATSLLVEFVVDSALSFRMVNKPSFLRFVDALRPMYSSSLLKRTKLKRLVTDRAGVALTEMHGVISSMEKIGHRVGMVIDGWESTSKEHVNGVVLAVEGEAFYVQCDNAGTEHDGLAVSRGWETLIAKYAEQYKISYHCSDDAGQCARARRIMRLRYPDIL